MDTVLRTEIERAEGVHEELVGAVGLETAIVIVFALATDILVAFPVDAQSDGAVGGPAGAHGMAVCKLAGAGKCNEIEPVAEEFNTFDAILRVVEDILGCHFCIRFFNEVSIGHFFRGKGTVGYLVGTSAVQAVSQFIEIEAGLQPNCCKEAEACCGKEFFHFYRFE